MADGGNWKTREGLLAVDDPAEVGDAFARNEEYIGYRRRRSRAEQRGARHRRPACGAAIESDDMEIRWFDFTAAGHTARLLRPSIRGSSRLCIGSATTTSQLPRSMTRCSKAVPAAPVWAQSQVGLRLVGERDVPPRAVPDPRARARFVAAGYSTCLRPDMGCSAVWATAFLHLPSWTTCPQGRLRDHRTEDLSKILDTSQ